MIKAPRRGISYLQGRFTSRNDFAHRQRVSEYQLHQCTLETAIVQATGIEELTVAKTILHDSSLSNFWSEVKTLARRDVGAIPVNYDADFYLAQMSYYICRLLQPTIVVETGVAHGTTSAFILRALADNDKGHLFSIDLPILRWRAQSVTGIAVPGELKGGWTLCLGDSRRLLPRLLQQVGSIDLFLHDSRHTYQHQMMEYTATWPYLRAGGVLLSDDICNDAFIEFAEARKVCPLIVARSAGEEGWFGLLPKP